ncbi:MAG: DUF4340 domain-containing protein [Lachnospiraceae bacterium]|nr:DUF4340 domain-containing protein [Lachnospiraceae bacterium]
MAFSKRRKKKNLILLGSLAIIIIALIVLIIIFGAGKKKEEEEEQQAEEKTVKVFDIAKEDVAKITFSGKDGEVTLQKNDDGIWKIASHPELEVKTDKVESLLSSATSLNIIKMFSDNEDEKESFGIKADSSYLILANADGAEKKVVFGMLTPTSADNCYACLTDTGTIFSTKKSIVDLIDTDENAFVQLPEYPTIDATYLTRISYSDKNQSIVLINEPEDLTESNAIGTTSWYYRLWDRYMATDYDAMKDLLSAVTSMKYQRSVAADADDETLDKFGLKSGYAILKLDYTELADANDENSEKLAKSFVLYIGSKTEEGEVYCRVEGERDVYTVEASKTSLLTDVVLEDKLMSRYPALCLFDAVKSINVAYGTRGFDVEIIQIKGTDEEGNETVSYECLLNGSAYDESETRTLFASLIRIGADHILSGSDEYNTENILFSCTFHTSFEDRPEITYKIMEGDGIYYVLSLDGHAKYAVTKQEFTTLLERMEGYYR